VTVNWTYDCVLACGLVFSVGNMFNGVLLSQSDVVHCVIVGQLLLDFVFN
jgi:hypothetical protein